MTTRPTSDTSSTGTASGYVFDNAGQPTAQRFTGLAAVYDPGTIRHLTARGVGPGWQCLEVGAGGGSIAVWLAEEVGPSGTVVATDIDTRFLDGLARPNLEIRRHDIATDPLPAAAFDLVHTRLVLVHLPTRDAVLARLVAALRPGGWLVVEEFGAPALQPDPVLDPAEVPLKAHAVLQQVTAVHGVDNLYGRRIAGRLRALGLVDIGAEGHAFLWSGGSAGARVVQAGIAQLREAIVATGHVTEQELEDDLARLEDPALAWPSPRLMWSVWGRRPAAPEGEAAQRRSGAREPARETFRRVVREAGEAGLPHYQAYAALGYAEEHLGSRVADAAMLDTALTAMRPLGGPLYARVLARSLGYGSLPGSIAERRALAEQAVAIAVESGDVLAHYHALGTKGVFDPLPQDQLAGAQEMQRLAQQLGDDELLADSLRATVSPLLALGRIDEMAAAVAAYTRIAERLRQPFFRSWPALWQASRALRDGRLAEVEALAEQALGEEAGSLNAWFYYTEQLTLLRLLEGRAGELYALLDDPRQHPASEVLGSRKARALAAEGRLAEARSLFERLAAQDFRAVLQLAGWALPIPLACLADVCVALGDRARGARLYDILMPYAGTLTCGFFTAYCEGAVDRRLGLLAGLLERWDAAAAHFEAALRLHEQVGARVWLAQTQREYAELLLRRPPRTAQAVEQARSLLQEACASYEAIGIAYAGDRSKQMATSTGTHRTISRRFLVTAAAGALAVAAVAGAGTWRLTHNGATKSAVTTSAQVQQPQPQTSAVQAAAVPAPLSHTVSGPALDNSLVLVSSDTQAATLQQAFADADAIRFGMGLAPLNASVVAAPSDQQGIDAANAIRAAMGEPPLTAPDESYASIIADENTLRASLGLTPIALIDLR